MQIKDNYTKEEVIGILGEIQDEIIQLHNLHERYRNCQFSKDMESKDEAYIAAYTEANSRIARKKSDLRDMRCKDCGDDLG